LQSLPLDWMRLVCRRNKKWGIVGSGRNLETSKHSKLQQIDVMLPNFQQCNKASSNFFYYFMVSKSGWTAADGCNLVEQNAHSANRRKINKILTHCLLAHGVPAPLLPLNACLQIGKIRIKQR
jgi:hypothetical protein